VLDTDVCVEWLRRRKGVPARLKALSPADLAITTMTEAELRFGALRSRDPEGNLEQIEAILESGLSLLPFDRAAALHHAAIRYALRAAPIGERDLVIASVARSSGFAIATGNAAELARVPDLIVDDWLG
jgi:tRNA(fMet)-specific endonuclease VapC